MKHIFAFIVASILTVAYSATASSKDLSLSDNSVEVKHCQCINNDCGCCGELDMHMFGINGTVCTNFTYLPNDYGISVTLTYNNYTVYNATVSARNPPPICFGIPDLEKIQAHVCMRFYDITYGEKHLHGCVKLSVSIYHVIHKSIDIGCFNIPKEALIDETEDLIEMLTDDLEAFEHSKDEIPLVNMI